MRLKSSQSTRLPFNEWYATCTASYRGANPSLIKVPSYINIGKEAALSDLYSIPVLDGTTSIPKELISFNEARAIYNHGKEVYACVHFFIPDVLFNCLFNSTLSYVSLMQSFKQIIAPDQSILIGMSQEEQAKSVYNNRAFAYLCQLNGVEVIPNVSWAEPRTYDLCFTGQPQNSVIAINSKGILHDPRSVYFWLKGYEEALKRLNPTFILRCGPKIPGEDESISKYYPNPVIERLRHGR